MLNQNERHKEKIQPRLHLRSAPGLRKNKEKESECEAQIRKKNVLILCNNASRCTKITIGDHKGNCFFASFRRTDKARRKKEINWFLYAPRVLCVCHPYSLCICINTLTLLLSLGIFTIQPRSFIIIVATFYDSKFIKGI